MIAELGALRGSVSLDVQIWPPLPGTDHYLRLVPLADWLQLLLERSFLPYVVSAHRQLSNWYLSVFSAWLL